MPAAGGSSNSIGSPVKTNSMKMTIEMTRKTAAICTSLLKRKRVMRGAYGLFEDDLLREHVLVDPHRYRDAILDPADQLFEVEGNLADVLARELCRPGKGLHPLLLVHLGAHDVNNPVQVGVAVPAV